jgi:hypothetical protein
MKNRALLVKILVAASFVVMIAVNALSDLLPINGVTTQDVSNKYPTLITPAPVTFAIWGAIYLLLAAFTLYSLGLFRSRTEPPNEEALRQLGSLFAVSSFLNALWILAWHYELIALSVILIALLLIYLIQIMKTAGRYGLSPRDKWLVYLPFGVYAGWITVATLSNAAAWLVSINWHAFGIADEKWAVAVLAAGALTGAAAVLRWRNAAAALALMWGYAGILLKHLSPSGFNGEYPAAATAAGVCLAFFALVLAGVLIRKQKAPRRVYRPERRA